jgi:superfamily II DNA or RNA helicase
VNPPESDKAPTVLDIVVAQSKRVLETYRVDAGLIQEHANNERRIAQGGYGDRQVFELVQNAADEIREQHGGEIAVVLTATHLYCANEGTPVTQEGADTILRMSVSRKRGGQIGRFGVGVKSVLAISDTPQFFSRADGAEFGFGFDREWSADLVRAVYPGADETPVLRMAQPLDPAKSRQTDPVLNELMKWATTVVRLPLKPERIKNLGKDIATFPVEFPLFSPHVGTITLEDRRSGQVVKRQIFQLVEGEQRTLQEVRPDEVSTDHRWKVFTRTHQPTPAALRAAGELHDRPEIDISWAVPERSGSRGTFWAYFPTKFSTTLRGILNAPWKTSEDRQAIFDGNAFNDELIRIAAELVVDSLPKLSTSEDPAVYIDFLPGRGREAPQFADERLTAAIWHAAAQRPSLPNQNGAFRSPAEMLLHPQELRPEWLKLWASYEGRPVDWVHHSVEKRERRARVASILKGAGKPEQASVREWLEALVQDGRASGSALAIRIIADMVRSNHPLAEEAARSRVVLTESHGMVAPMRGKVFRRSTTDDLQDDMVYVAEQVLVEFDVIAALDVLGVRDADAPGRFAAVVDQGFHGYSDAQWVAFWELSRAAGAAQTLDVLRRQVNDSRKTLKVRTLSGEFRRIHDCLMPGPVVPADGSRDGRIAMDVRFHADDRVVLKDLGLIDRPILDQDPRDEPWFDKYVETAWEAHLKTLDDKAHRPQKTTMKVEGANPAGPLHFLEELSPEGRAAFLRYLPEHGLVAQWTVQVGRQQGTRIAIKSPLVWLAQTQGFLETSQGLSSSSRCVGPALAKHADVLPVARISEALATALKLPSTLSQVRASLWKATIAQASRSEDDAFPGRVYALLFEAGAAWPNGATTRCRVGDKWSSDVEGNEIAVTAVRAEYDALVLEGLPALLAPTAEAAEQMVETWGMLTPSEVIQKEVRFVEESAPVLLLDLFPHLRSHRNAVDGWSLIRCSELDEITHTPNGMRTAPLRQALHERSVLVLRPEGDLEALMAVDTALKLGLGPNRCRSILELRKKQHDSERLKAIRAATTEEEKLLELIGEDQLRAGLVQGLEDAEKAKTGKTPTGKRLAQLAKNTFGEEGLFRHYSKAIAARNDEAPSTFSGSTASRKFVAELGLPESYAGTRAITPPDMEEISGPTDYPRLHDYQERLAENMVRLLVQPMPGRAMLRLPTGAGKTRVAVEAVIRVVRERGVKGPILWIAQSDELCEQAVESWKFVWSKVGPQEKLTINRLWGSNAAVAVTNNTQLVVATDAKLDIHLKEDEYAWLRNAALVIVDEAHAAIAPRYTRILEQLGLTRSRTARSLVGLTATPFRNNEDDTRRLIDRFGNNRLDDGIFGDQEPYAFLQSLGVLAHVDHHRLTGSTLSLNESERAETEKFGVLPSSAEEQLALDDDRNQMLLNAIDGLDEDWPVLVFATSVNHAKLLTAMLNDRGISSASIDSFTPMPERRNKIEKYRNKEIRVITNFGVLAQGFDAPATQAVVIARPTYSPNIYQQMIGRGLRGPKNGGEKTCRILDVEDNIVNYGKALAFNGFEHLWGKK